MVEGQDALPVGAQIGEFEILKILGRGGFGITYLANDDQLNRKVVLKEYMPEGFASRGSDGTVKAPSDTKNETFQWGLDRFSAEAQTLAQFRHPAIVSVQRLLADQSGTAFIVMDYLKGGNLEETVTQNGTYVFKNFAPIFASLLDGCRAVHDLEILHRDIKPLNIMMVDGKPVLIDFGAARQLERQQKGAVSRIFADGYSPLEQYTSSQDQGEFTDIYALAATAYFAFVGEDPSAAPARVAGDELPPLKQAAAGKAPDQFFEAIEWGLQLKAKDRPQSIEEWLTAFPDFEEKQVIIREVTVDGIDRRKLMLGGAAVGGVAIAGLGGYLITRPPAKPDVSDVIRPLKVTSSKIFGSLLEDSYARIIPYQSGAYFVGHKGKGNLGNVRSYAQQIDSSLNSVGDGYTGSGGSSLGRDLMALPNGEVLIGGAGRLRVGSSGDLASDIEVTKLSPSGERLWTKYFGEGSLNSFVSVGKEIVFAGEDINLGNFDELQFIDLDGDKTRQNIKIGDTVTESVERFIASVDGDIIALNFRWRKNQSKTSTSLSRFFAKDGEVIKRWSISDEEYLIENSLNQTRPHSLAMAYDDIFAVGRVYDDTPPSQGGYRASFVYRVDSRKSGKIVWRKHGFHPKENETNRFAARTVKAVENGQDIHLFCGSENFDTKASQIVQLNGMGEVIQSLDILPEEDRFQICDMCFDESGGFIIGNEYSGGEPFLAVKRIEWV